TMLGQLPLVAAFLLMVTALTYQFQGWLAALMVNKRRRRTVIVVATMAVILIAQLPNIINFVGPWNRHRPAQSEQDLKEQEELRDAISKGKLPPADYVRRLQERRRAAKARAELEDRQTLNRLEQSA